MNDRVLIIGNKNYSSWSLRPWVWMTHVGLEFEERRVPLFTPDTNATLEPYFSDYKVPVLIDQGRTIWDSLAILEYLAEQYPDTNGWPEDPTERALARSAAAEMHSSFFNLRGQLPMNCRKSCPGFEITPEVRREVDRIESLWRRCREVSSHNGPFLFGEFGIVDAMYAPVVFRLATYHVSLADDSVAYRDSMLAVPAMQIWKEAGAAETEVIKEEEVCDQV